MKIAGIVAEYNPFHNGHKYHIEKTRLQTRADAVVAVMSGNFVQRGDCAVADKWTRAKSAILGGADLVIELPVYYSLSSAPLFAFGAVSILDALGCVDYISFGMETDNINKLSSIAENISKNPDALEQQTQKYLDNYTGYSAARRHAISALYGADESFLNGPNNMLALEYMCALSRLSSTITPIGITRLGADHHDTKAFSKYSSASALRERLYAGKSISKAVPKDVSALYKKASKSALFPVLTQHFDKMLISHLRRTNPSELQNIIDMPQGFENRIVSMANKAGSIDELTKLCCARQYTYSRIRRLLFASFIGIHFMGYDKKPTYIRVLALNDTGKKVLAKMNENCTLPIITKAASYDKKDSDELFMLDTLATDLYSAAYENVSNRAGGKDFTTSPIIL